jgi:hypothetical protein
MDPDEVIGEHKDDDIVLEDDDSDCEEYIDNGEEYPRLKLKFEGDGRKMSKHNGNVQLAFSILNEGTAVLKPMKHYCFAIMVPYTNRHLPTRTHTHRV